MNKQTQLEGGKKKALSHHYHQIMFANAPHDHNRRELDEIVEDLPSANIADGPSSITQRTSTRLHCTNPDDLSRIRKIKHFQEYVVDVTKNGIYFVAESLERMFPEDSVHTKILLGTSSASKLLVNNGATVAKDDRLGTVFNFMLDSLSRSNRDYQDPFSACDLPMPSQGLPITIPTTSSSPFAIPGPSSSTLGVGLNVNLGSFWRTLFLGKGNFWDTLIKTGIKPFFYGMVVGFVDEILGSLVPVRYRGKLEYIKNLFKGASSFIGTAVLVVMIANKSMTLTSALLTVLIAFVGNVVGGAIGSAMGKLLEWIVRNYFPSTNFYAPGHLVLNEVDEKNSNKPTIVSESPINAALHNCGQDNNGYIYVGLCINCNNKPALYGFVHRDDDVAHSAFCLNCFPLYRRPMCVCCAEISSTYYFSPATLSCAAQTCVRVSECVTCDEEGISAPNYACVWRLKKAEETVLTRKTVTLDVRYCSDHQPKGVQSDQFRYGKLYSMGYY